MLPAMTSETFCRIKSAFRYRVWASRILVPLGDATFSERGSPGKMVRSTLLAISCCVANTSWVLPSYVRDQIVWPSLTRVKER